jgi:hypothetical protein
VGYGAAYEFGRSTETTFGSPEFPNDALNGGDIAESTLGTVPAAAQGGTGRYASQGSCDPESATYVNCAFVPVPLVKPARVLLTAQVEAWTERDSDNGWGGCRLEVNGNPLVSSRTEFAFHDPGEEYTAWNQNSESATLVAVTGVLPAGNPVVGIECNQSEYKGAIQYKSARVAAVALSDG